MHEAGLPARREGMSGFAARDGAPASVAVPGPVRRDVAERLGVALVLVLACVALMATAPSGDDFWWSDAPRHALNGAFVKDFVAALPWHDPQGWAMRYYLHYPALTILFYPPLFYPVEAAVFAVLGVGEGPALVAVGLFVLLLAGAAYGIGRMLLPRWSAVGFALLLLGLPEVALWARQVMLDVPSFAALAACTFLFMRHMRGGRAADLFGAVLCLLAAIYIKLNAVFLAPVLAAALLTGRGWAALRDRRVLAAAALGVIGLVPAVLLTLKFGMANLQSVAGREGDLSHFSLASWLFYPRLVPEMMGWPALLLGVAGLGLWAAGRLRLRERWLGVLLLGWLGFGYAFVSYIGVKEPRHGMMVLLPLVLLAPLALHAALPGRVAQAASLLLGAGTLAASLLRPVPVVAGYGAVADYVAAHAPRDALVLYSGYRDGNFIFALRSHAERDDIATLRTDKRYLSVAVERSRGVGQSGAREADIARDLRELGVDLVVYQPGFWEDLEQMQRIARVIHSPDFERVASFPITGELSRWDADRVEIYRPTYTVEHGRRSVQLNLPIIGRKIEGTIPNGAP